MTTLLALAAALPLYRATWDGRAPRSLAEAPFVTPWNWRRLVDRRPGRSLRQPPALWALHPIPGDDPIWTPHAHEDIAAAARRARAVFREAGIRPGDVVLSIAPEGPWVANALPFLLAAADSLIPDLPPLGVQVFPLSALTVAFKADLTVFPFAQMPSVLVGAAADIRAVADLAQRAGVPPLHCRLLLLLGPPPEAESLAQVAETVVPLLHLPGTIAPFGGHPGSAGVWLPAAVVSADVIPDEEWGRALQHPAYVPPAVPVAAALGTTGELVVSLANQALPIVRLRTQERVRVVEVGADGAYVVPLGSRSVASSPQVLRLQG